MNIESDEAVILSGVRHGRSIGSPIAIMIENLDHKNWGAKMKAHKAKEEIEQVTVPRPGHADLSGLLKTGLTDARDVLERASARETAARVAAGAIFKLILRECGIGILSHVISIGEASYRPKTNPDLKDLELIDKSPVRTLSLEAERAMVAEIEGAIKNGYSLGGVFEVMAMGLPAGLGGYQTIADRLDGRLASAVMSIPAIKGVEVGAGFELARLTGDIAQDEIAFATDKGFYRKTNLAGGLEGGMTNGETLIIRAAMKPIPTQSKPLMTVDIISKETKEALKERSDVCAVAAAAVVAESMVAFELAKAAIEKFGGDSMADMKNNYDAYMLRIKGV